LSEFPESGSVAQRQKHKSECLAGDLQYNHANLSPPETIVNAKTNRRVLGRSNSDKSHTKTDSNMEDFAQERF
jgi:hypothetical protein